jgi:hypothetical protein
MRIDRATKVLLAFIAAGLWALVFSLGGPAEFLSPAEASASGSSGSAYRAPQKMDAERARPRTPTATLPLRWRIPTAFENVNSNATFCTTVVSVLNATASPINVEVEWLHWGGTSQALRPKQLPASQLLHWVSDHQINIWPYFPDDDAGLVGFAGYVNVHADDPRILVTAVMMCRDDTFATPLAKIRVHDTIPAFPVGVTMEYFQAGMPATSTPPTVGPEVPE